MKKARVLWLCGIAAAAVSGFVAGLWVGAAPLRRSWEMGGGPLESFARDLQAVAMDLSDRSGETRDPRQVVKQRVVMADLLSTNAALSYCRMMPDYQRLARQAAATLERNRYVLEASDPQARRARQYMLHADPARCVPFRDDDVVTRR